ncbi:hypothetical protein LPJ66_005381 [Kickxella alabastrina]|uniref:Uncharacterized protein n=1 Tax=Kickxella alabastrina TaxID=61397 RepID=A0ACC1IEQ2_9FUNG|nr:hypothetical protein LPJ66_005381 [Kickxella alabastrina]
MTGVTRTTGSARSAAARFNPISSRRSAPQPPVSSHQQQQQQQLHRSRMPVIPEEVSAEETERWRLQLLCDPLGLLDLDEAENFDFAPVFGYLAPAPASRNTGSASTPRNAAPAPAPRNAALLRVPENAAFAPIHRNTAPVHIPGNAVVAPASFASSCGSGSLAVASVPTLSTAAHGPAYHSKMATDSTPSSTRNANRAIKPAKRLARRRSEKKHPCGICGRSFARPSSLASHVLTHSGEKPYDCPAYKCGKSFSVLSNMRRHYKQRHCSGYVYTYYDPHALNDSNYMMDDFYYSSFEMRAPFQSVPARPAVQYPVVNGQMHVVPSQRSTTEPQLFSGRTLANQLHANMTPPVLVAQQSHPMSTLASACVPSSVPIRVPAFVPSPAPTTPSAFSTVLATTPEQLDASPYDFNLAQAPGTNGCPIGLRNQQQQHQQYLSPVQQQQVLQQIQQQLNFSPSQQQHFTSSPPQQQQQQRQQRQEPVRRSSAPVILEQAANTFANSSFGTGTPEIGHSPMMALPSRNFPANTGNVTPAGENILQVSAFVGLPAETLHQIMPVYNAAMSLDIDEIMDMYNRSLVNHHQQQQNQQQTATNASIPSISVPRNSVKGGTSQNVRTNMNGAGVM